MTEADQETLHEAIARNAAAVLSLPSAGILRHHKTRFLSVADGGFYIESIPAEADLIDELIIAQKPVGIAFKSATTRIIFAAPVWKRQLEFRLNKDTTVEALLLPFPDSVKSVQRRASYRVYVPNTSGLIVRVWRIADHTILRDKPSAKDELQCRVRDVSIGGMGLVCPPKDGHPASLATDQRLRVLIVRNQYEALVDGRVCHTLVAPDKSLRVGVQFNKLEADIEGRHALAKLTSIVGELHREEVRRLRLGVLNT